MYKPFEVKKYVKKPIEVEALNLDLSQPNKFVKVFGEFYGVYACDEFRYIIIKTLEGEMTAKHGDYVIKGVEDEVYPCKREIFEKTYDSVS